MASAHPLQHILDNFTRNAATYNRVGPPIYSLFAERLLDLLGPRPGQRGLDVCCGTGAVAIPFASRVAPGGSVVAVDLTPAMLERATEDARSTGVDNLDLREGDATNLDLPPTSFDVVTCGFGIQFQADPVAALAHWASFLAPGGRLGCSTWAARDFEPLMTVARELLLEEGVAADPFAGRTTRSSENLLHYARQAGLANARCLEESRSVTFLRPADAVQGTPRGRNVLNPLPADRRESVRAELIRRLEGLAGPEGLSLEIGLLYLIGERRT
ncbi:MAG TPA: methyltransferase domain-containing protein [Chloroflexota bacterium]|nr:methyltransferase domain-containing protein [Chloroflexota bacterium]